MKPYLSVFLLVLVMGCARSVTRMNPSEAVDLSGRWNDTDSREVANSMMADLLGSEKFKEYAKALAKKPTIIVGLVRNKTSEHIDSDTYIKKLELAIFNSGVADLVESDAFRDKLREERAQQQDFADPATVAKWGVEQIIIGSAAFRSGAVDTRFLRQFVSKIKPTQIVIALDTEKGGIVTNGWRRKLNLRPESVMEQLQPFCAAFLCTDVDREGTMSGANLEWFRKLREATSHRIIAAGGIKTRHEITALEAIGMDAAVGMAVYKNRLR